MIIEAIETLTDRLAKLSCTNGKLDVNIEGGIILAIERGDAYQWSTHHSSSNNAHVFYIRNPSTTQDLFIVRFTCSSSLKTLFILNKVTGAGSGSNSLENNLDLSLSTPSGAIHLANNVSDLGTIIEFPCRSIPAEGTTTFIVPRGYKLPANTPNLALTVQIEKGGTDTCIEALGFFEDA